MKINRVSQNKERKFSWQNFLIEIYNFFRFYRYLAFCIIGLAVLIFIFLLVADHIAHRPLKSLDTKATLELFDQLQEANRHHDAIILMEYKGDIINGSPRELEYKSKLSDSYIHVGDYSKAEKMLLDVWENTPKYLTEFEDKNKLSDKRISDALKYGIARIIYQFYEKIGDKNNQIKYYQEYKRYYDQCRDYIDSVSTMAYNSKSWVGQMTDENNREIMEYDSIVVLYETDKSTAIIGMGNYIDKIIPRKEYNPSFKVKCINKLIKWDLDEDNLMDVYHRIAQAIAQVRLMKSPFEYSRLGDLSDYCYEVHDVEMSKSLFYLYKDFLDKNYKKDDFEYLSNYYPRRFRYLEEEKEWDKLSTEVVDYCTGMRKQIALNIPTMTDEQRELFAKQFDEAYFYAFHLLQKYPTDELAALCFDNITFKAGLLLRSIRSLRNSIENLNDPEATQLFNELDSCRRELIPESLGPRIFTNREKKLSDRISEIEKTLAFKCTDFKIKNQLNEYGYGDIRKKLAKDEAIVDFVENDGNLFALVLRNKNDVQYVPIGNIEDIAQKLRKSTSEIYHDADLTNFLWSNVSNIVKDCSTIYYMPLGRFNQIAISSLYVGNDNYLCDLKDWKLISNPTIIANNNNFSLSDSSHTITLWGGIDYGGPSTNELPKGQYRRATKRGDLLTSLQYAYDEVMDISSMLGDNHIKNKTYTKNVATEESFRNRSGKKDYVIHISTHGFFNDTLNMVNDNMLQSGLFFAGANKFWSNDSINLNPKKKDDGILYAENISTLNLSGCSLVVLSACETGLGFYDSSEGVYGLQRAFKLAGADLILMSLWDIDDRATYLLMTEFYKHLLIDNDIDKALKESKEIVREKYPSPEDWGGFVLLY